MEGIRNKKGFTVIELMVVVCSLSLLASIAIPMFATYQTRSKASESTFSLSKMTEGQITYRARSLLFTAAGPTNIPPPRFSSIVDFSTDPRWQLINFGFSTAVYYGYQAVLNTADEVDCEALGDLDGDGVLSTFRRTVTHSPTGTVASQISIFDELE